MDMPQLNNEHYAIHWPEPPHVKFDIPDVADEPCEIEFKTGAKEIGNLLHFTGREAFLIFRPHRTHAQHANKIAVKLSNVKQLRLTQPIGATLIDDETLGQSGAVSAPSQIQVYNVEFTDGEITSGETVGYVKLPLGVFLYFQGEHNALMRSFIPEDAIAYFQAGDPIGKLLVDENVVSEEQLKEAVEKQQEMRKLVLGDYLIEQGYITQAQLAEALVYQQSKPSLRLGEALIEMGVLSGDALQSALARQRANRGRPLGQILVDMGVLDPDTLKKVHAKKLGMPFVSLARFNINADALKLVPADTARRLGVVPLAVEDGALIVATSSQPDASAMAELGLMARMRVVPVIASGEEIREKQNAFYGPDASPADGPISDPSSIRFVESSAISLPADDVRLADLFANGKTLDVFEQVTLESERALLQIVNRMLAAAIRGGALDIHIETEGEARRTRIRYVGGSEPG